MKQAVLLVDDDPIFQFAVRSMIEQIDKDVDLKVFNNGVEFISFLKDKSSDDLPALTLLDLNMPLKNGWEVLEDIPTINSKLPLKIYVCSSSIDPLDIKRAKESYNVEDYIIKPITLEQIRALIETV